MKPGQEKIWKVLSNSDGLTFTQLKNETKLSAPALSSYLKSFEGIGLIAYDEDNKLYFIPIGKRESSFTPEKFEVFSNKRSEMRAHAQQDLTEDDIIDYLSAKKDSLSLVWEQIIKDNYLFSQELKNTKKEELRDKFFHWLTIQSTFFSALNLLFLEEVFQDLILSKILNEDPITTKRTHYKNIKRFVKEVFVAYYDSILTVMIENKKSLIENDTKIFDLLTNLKINFLNVGISPEDHKSI